MTMTVTMWSSLAAWSDARRSGETRASLARLGSETGRITAPTGPEGAREWFLNVVATRSNQQ